MSSIALFRQVSVKHIAAEFEKSLLLQESRIYQSVLLDRDRRKPVKYRVVCTYECPAIHIW